MKCHPPAEPGAEGTFRGYNQELSVETGEVQEVPIHVAKVCMAQRT